MTTTHDLRTWLGPAAEQLTTEQQELLAAEADRLAELWPDEDDADLREHVLSAVVQYMLGDLSVDEAGRQLLEARLAERRALAAACRVAAAAVAAGMSQVEAARRACVDRMTLRKTLGKR